MASVLVRPRLSLRVGRELGFKANLDLLPATRRLYKRRLRDCSLINIEREIFSFHREDDTPGNLNPPIYFDWLASENANQFPGVLEHNRWDILAMYFLLERLVRVAESEGELLDELDDVYSLQRLYQRRKSSAKVMKICQRLTEQSELIEPDMQLFQALAFKRSGDWDRAVEIWQTLKSLKSRVGYEANLELAKFFEHRQKDPAKALKATKRALGNRPAGSVYLRALAKRQTQLENKLQISA